MVLIFPNFDVKSIIFSQVWPGAFSALDKLLGQLGIYAT